MIWGSGRSASMSIVSPVLSIIWMHLSWISKCMMVGTWASSRCLFMIPTKSSSSVALWMLLKLLLLVIIWVVPAL